MILDLDDVENDEEHIFQIAGERYARLRTRKG